MTSRLDELFEGLPPRLDARQVAELLAMSPKGVYGWIKRGEIPAYQVAGTWVILRDELRDAIAAGSNQSEAFRRAQDGDASSEDDADL